MDKKEHSERLATLHIEVLRDILKGKLYGEIRENRSKAFEILDYEHIMKDKANRLTFDVSGNLIGAYPVCPLPTMHKITVAGTGTGYAMCAIDALGATHTFNAPVTVESKLTDTKESIQFTLSAKHTPENDYVVSYNKLDYDSLQELVAANSQLAVDACPAINFYSSADKVPDGLETIDFATAIEESKAIFSQEAIRQHILESL